MIIDSQKTNSTSSRRSFLKAAAGVCILGNLGGCNKRMNDSNIDEGPVSDLDHEIGRNILRQYPSIDIHSHLGRSFAVGGEFTNETTSRMDGGFEIERIQDMRNGLVTCSMLSLVADIQVIEFSGERGVGPYRKFDVGEAIEDFYRQINRVKSLSSLGILNIAKTSEEIIQAHRQNETVVLLAFEGAGFVGEDLDRLEAAQELGVSSINLIHYRPSEYGDSQTLPPMYGGLSPLGIDVIKEMNRLGIVIDAAHASFETTQDMVTLSTAPIILSHSHLKNMYEESARLISGEHADLIAESGGVIGSWPSGYQNKTINDYVDETLRLVDRVGVDHVAVGTDLDLNYKPVITDYHQFPELATLLIAKGLTDVGGGKSLGVNFLRVLNAAAKVASN